MTKTVFGSHDMTAHVWAQGNHEYGRSGDRRMFFEGPVLYSYGNHFVIAALVPDGVVLFNSDRYSVSTSNHQLIAQRAARHLTSRYVPNLTKIANGNWSALDIIHRAKNKSAGFHDRAVERLPEARKKIIEHVETHAEKISETAAIYLLKLAGVPASRAAARFANMKAMQERRTAAAARTQQKQEKKFRLRHAKAWSMISEVEFGRRLVSEDTFSQEAARAIASKLRLFRLAAKEMGWNNIAEILRKREKIARKRIKAMKDSSKPSRNLQRYMAVKRSIRAHIEYNSETVGLYALQQFQRHLNDAILLAPRLAKSEKIIALRAKVRDALAKALAIHREEEARRAAAAAEERARRIAEREAAIAEARAAWLAGERPRNAYSFTDEAGGALIRAVGVERNEAGEIIGGTLQTSKGADVPLTHAVKAFKFLKLCHETGREWDANGHSLRVGFFTIDHVDQTGFNAGCHRINWPEVERLARSLGVFDVPADESPLEPSQSVA